MSKVLRAALCAAAILACSAQTPAPSGGQTIAIPLKTARHLEYAFNLSEYQSGEVHDSGFNGMGEGNGSGVESNFGSGGVRGIVEADVVALTNDGGLVVKLSETVENQPRAAQTFTCVVWGDGRLNCPNLASSTAIPGAVIGPSEPEALLLAFLGRGFLDAAKMDANNHWRIAYTTANAAVVADFTMTDPGDGKPVLVVETKKFTPRNLNVGAATEAVRVSYNRALSVPSRIDEEKHESWTGGTVQTTVNLQLTKDSFAPPPP